MGIAQSSDAASNASPEELSYLLAERFATKCFTPLELTHFKDNFFSRALDNGGIRYWNEKILSDFLGIPDGVGSSEGSSGGGADHASPLDAGPVIFRMLSYLGAFPFQTTLAPSVLTFEAMVKVVVLLTERYGKVLRRGHRDRIKLLFGSLADIGRKGIGSREKKEDAANEADEHEYVETQARSHVAGFAIDEPANDEDYEDDDDDLALAALESLDAIEVFKHDHRIDHAVYEARISVDTFRRLLMLLLVIAPLKPLESVSKYTSDTGPERMKAISNEADSILAAFNPDETVGGISYKTFAKTVSASLPYLFDPLTSLFEHLLFSKNLDLSRRRIQAEESPDELPTEKEPEIPSPPPSPVMMSGSFETAILNPSVLSHLSFFLPVSYPDPNLFRSGTRLHPVFSTAAHGESLTSFSHHVLTWDATALLLLQGVPEGEESDEKLITIGAYLPRSWKKTTSTYTLSSSNPSTLPSLFQLSPTHTLLRGNPSPSMHNRPSTPETFFSTTTGIGIGCHIPPSSRNKQPQPVPDTAGGGSLLIDAALETAQLHISQNTQGVFLPPAPPTALPPVTKINIYNLEIWGLIPPPALESSDPTQGGAADAISAQRAKWNFEAREAERRRNINLKVGGGGADMQTARALLEMAGIVGDGTAGGRSGGSV
ncbi:hypothetical protein VTN00DRAFT_8409 [Thermoascus crustaceus]|uniref:uncharacterized protein n=1 Tax=Thermoascus crustaceus TaxID=5088 RepID=UPI0037429D7B